MSDDLVNGAEYQLSQNDDVFEEENLGEDIEIEKPPFNPTQINIITKQDTLINIIQRLRHDEIDLSPEYQRNFNLWSSAQQSRLIESILIRIPLPAFYFDCSSEEQWEIVDGLQRLSTIKNFVIDQKLALSGLEYLNHLKGKRYDDLERQYMRRIDECPITYFQITPGTPQEVKYSIFRRINTGGLVLNEQEIRNAMALSHSRKFLQNLVLNENFIRVTACSDGLRKRMKDHELVLRFLAFYHLDVLKESFTNIGELLNKMMTVLDHSIQKQRDEWKRVFDIAMERCWCLFGDRAFEKSVTHRVRKNTPLYEVWSVCMARLTNDQWYKLQPYLSEISMRHQRLWESDNDYNRSVTYATQKKEHIEIRYNTVKNILSFYD